MGTDLDLRMRREKPQQLPAGVPLAPETATERLIPQHTADIMQGTT
jgi:hypothetical protein